MKKEYKIASLTAAFEGLWASKIYEQNLQQWLKYSCHFSDSYSDDCVFEINISSQTIFSFPNWKYMAGDHISLENKVFFSGFLSSYRRFFITKHVIQPDKNYEQRWQFYQITLR